MIEDIDLKEILDVLEEAQIWYIYILNQFKEQINDVKMEKDICRINDLINTLIKVKYYWEKIRNGQ